MINCIFKFLVGITLFVFGMNSLTNGLKKINSHRIKHIIKKIDNKFNGLWIGTIITAFCQSSSFITVLLVSLVDSNIITLNNSIGIIMGSNIGTCLTSWILSFSHNKTMILSFLDIDNMLGIIALLSIIYLRKRHLTKASILFGLVILLLGMSTMTDSLSPLAQSNTFQKILFYLANPLLGLFLGILITSIFQSSSLVIGLLESISLTAHLPFLSGFTVILGSNIGSCTTALLSSINTSKTSKIVSLFHLLFNIIGTIIFLTSFYLLNYFFNFKFTYQNITPTDIALIHTIFNVASTIILLPFTNVILKLCQFLVKEK